MLGYWWVFWVAFMLVFFVTPVSYGWGYRGWGAPYPRYIQQRRATALGTQGPNHRAWGLGGDFVWVVVAIGVFWLLAGFWWHR